MIETEGKSKATKKIKYVRYICICDWMNVKFEETITLYCDIRPDRDFQRRFLRAKLIPT